MSIDIDQELADALEETGGPELHLYTGGKGGISKTTRISSNLAEMMDQVKQIYPALEGDTVLLRTALYYFCHAIIEAQEQEGFASRTESISNQLLVEEERRLEFLDQINRLGKILKSYEASEAFTRGLQLYQRFVKTIEAEADPYWKSRFLINVDSQRDVADFLAACERLGIDARNKQ